MAYEKQTWQSNELLTSEKLNHMEDGIAEAKTIQTAINDPTASGTAIAFIDSIEQNTQGVITPTKKEIPIVNNLTEMTSGKVLDATQGKVLNDTKLDKDFNFTAATLPYLNNEKIALRGTDGNNYYTTIGELASQIGGEASQTALVHYIKNCGTISSLNWTNPQIDNNITENMVVLKAELSNPAAQTSDWTCTTTNGYVTITGTIASGSSTNVLLYFGVSLSTAPSIIVNLASNSSDNVLKTNPTPGVMGVLGRNNGGTGVNATDAADLRSKLGIGELHYYGGTTSSQWPIAIENEQEILLIVRIGANNSNNVCLSLTIPAKLIDATEYQFATQGTFGEDVCSLLAKMTSTTITLDARVNGSSATIYQTLIYGVR